MTMVYGHCHQQGVFQATSQVPTTLGAEETWRLYPLDSEIQDAKHNFKRGEAMEVEGQGVRKKPAGKGQAYLAIISMFT